MINDILKLNSQFIIIDYLILYIKSLNSLIFILFLMPLCELREHKVRKFGTNGVPIRDFGANFSNSFLIDNFFLNTRISRYLYTQVCLFLPSCIFRYLHFHILAYLHSSLSIYFDTPCYLNIYISPSI